MVENVKKKSKHKTTRLHGHQYDAYYFMVGSPPLNRLLRSWERLPSKLTRSLRSHVAVYLQSFTTCTWKFTMKWSGEPRLVTLSACNEEIYLQTIENLKTYKAVFSVFFTSFRVTKFCNLKKFFSRISFFDCCGSIMRNHLHTARLFRAYQTIKDGLLTFLILKIKL